MYFAELFHTDRGVTCSDSALIDLPHEQECFDALKYANSFHSSAKYGRKGSWGGSPKGCFIYDSGLIYFNSHLTGKNLPNARSICGSGKD